MTRQQTPAHAEKRRRDRRPMSAGEARADERSRPASPLRSPIVLITAAVAMVGLVVLAAATALGPPGVSPVPGGSDTMGLVRPTRSTPTTRADGTSLGPDAAPLILDLYSDFQCPVCARFDREDLQPLVADFVEPGYVRLNEHDIAILGDPGATYDESLEAATAAACAERQGRYWPYHDWVFANQDGENRGAFSRERLDAIARAIGLSQEAYAACMAGGDVRATIQRETQHALSSGVGQTPTLYIDGQPVAGVQPFDQLARYLRSRLHLPATSPITKACPHRTLGRGTASRPIALVSPCAAVSTERRTQPRYT